MAQVTGLRAPGGQVTLLKDKGEYDLWSAVLFAPGQATELRSFSYSIGTNVPGTGVAATRLETNLHVNNQFVDESMTVYGVALQFGRYTPGSYFAPPVAPYVPTFLDMFMLEAHTLFSFHIGGEKPQMEGKVTWFGEAGGWAGFSNVNLAEIIANNVPTPASARVVRYTLPIGRIEKFWGLFTFPRGAITGPMGGSVVVWTRLLGVRVRGVQ